MTTEKTPNYSAEAVERLKAVYVPEATQEERTAQVKALAIELNKSTRSVIAKLTTLELYVPKVYKTKQGKPVVKKEALVTAIEKIAGKELAGLEKATKKALETILEMVTPEPEAETESEVSES